MVGQGPLAGQFTPVEKARREAMEAELDAEWRVEATRLLEVLIAGGEEPNHARMMLGLEPIITGPEDDPRPWVTYYQPKEIPEANRATHEVMACDLCGAAIANIEKHMAYAHPDEVIDTKEQGSE